MGDNTEYTDHVSQNNQYGVSGISGGSGPRGSQDSTGTNAHHWTPMETWEAFKYKFRSDHALRVDVISRIMFPLVFAAFNIGYWMYYLMV